MIQDFWINLPVKDLGRSKEFFTALGFKFNTVHGKSASSACLLVGEKNVILMLFDEPTFNGFIQSEIHSATRTDEVLLSIGVQSKEEVDVLAQKAIDAGGNSNHKPHDMIGFMYGCVFSDLDGHRWNVLFMDHSAMGE